MPRVLPFAGLRYAAPSSELARLVSPPYDVISRDEQAELRALSPHNAVHIELPLDADGQPCSRYTSAAETLARWRREGVLVPEQRPAFYLSETEYAYGGETLRRRDLLAALSVEPWSSRAVLPHEHTMAGPKADRLELMRATHLNASPIWVLHRDRLAALDAAWTAADARPPTVEFTWRGERHRVWVVDDQASLAAIQAGFERGGPLYIADGHHRYETGLAFKAEAQTSVPGAGAILATVSWADDPGLLALPTHRVLDGLDPGLTLEEAETRWSDAFHAEYYPVWDPAPAEQIDALIQQLASSGRAAPSFGIYGLGHLDLFGILELRGRKPPEGALPAERSDAWKSLDVSLLHTLLVDPLVAKTGRPREQVLGYTRDVHEAFAAVRDGRASVAFFLNPTPVSGVLAVADANDRMPEKSTYFHPKPPAGLVMRDLNTTP
ncbi:MAG TPA: DUF1015 domain-containing protein [Chloroflexota bacterium]|nr:DUF1015 domain-containing protein [Chloroflexota bacterium]